MQFFFCFFFVKVSCLSSSLSFRHLSEDKFALYTGQSDPHRFVVVCRNWFLFLLFCFRQISFNWSLRLWLMSLLNLNSEASNLSPNNTSTSPLSDSFVEYIFGQGASLGPQFSFLLHFDGIVPFFGNVVLELEMRF